MLWDPRYSRAIHKFDRLTNYGSGVFNPSGREVVINRYGTAHAARLCAPARLRSLVPHSRVQQ